jgi:hypothetical protein
MVKKIERWGMREVKFIDKLDESSLNGIVGKQPEMDRDQSSRIA